MPRAPFLFGLVFYLVYLGMLVLGDAGLYMVAWQRSILANSDASSKFNRTLTTREPYDALEASFSDENDALSSKLYSVRAVATVDRQVPHSYGSYYAALDSGFKDCPDLRKALRLPNVNVSENVVLQTYLADHTLNFFHCIVTGRLGTRVDVPASVPDDATVDQMVERILPSTEQRPITARPRRRRPNPDAWLLRAA